MSVPQNPETFLSQSQGLQRLALQLLGDAQAAEDVVQETWLAALRQRPDPRHPGRSVGVSAGEDDPGLGPWLRRVCRNLALRRRRDDHTRQRYESVQAGAGSLAADEPERTSLRLQRRMTEALGELPEPGRSAVVMRYLEGMTYEEIAEQQDISEPAVRQRVSRCLSVLRSRLRKEFSDSEANDFSAGLLFGGLLMGSKQVAVAGIVALALVGFGVQRFKAASPDPTPEVVAAVAAEIASPEAEAREQSVASVPQVKAKRGEFGLTRAASEADSEFLRMVVLDIWDQPISAAWLVLDFKGAEEAANDLFTEEYIEQSVESGAGQQANSKGQIRIAASVLAGESQLALGAAGYQTQFLPNAELESARMGSELKVNLHRLPIVELVLEDTLGVAVSPVAYGSLRVRTAPDQRKPESFDGGVQAGNRIRFEGLPVGTLEYHSVDAKDYVSAFSKQNQELALDEVFERRVVLDPGAIVSGRILDEDSGEPIAAARVWGRGFNPSVEYGPFAVTDSGGHFVLRGVEVEPRTSKDHPKLAIIRMSAEADGHPAVRMKHFFEQWSETNQYSVELSIQRVDSSLEGVVFQSDGVTPAAGVQVLIADPNMNIEFSFTDDRGRFEFENVMSGEVGMAAMTAIGGGRPIQMTNKDVELEQGQRKFVELTLSPSGVGVIEGSLREANGLPVQAGSVGLDFIVRVGSMSLAMERLKATTDEQGKFRFEGLPPAEFRLSPGDGNGCLEPKGISIDLEQDSEHKGCDFVVHDCVRFGGRLELTAVDPPLDQTYLLLVPVGSDSRAGKTRTHLDGTFSFKPVPAGRYEIRLEQFDEVLTVQQVGPASDEAIVMRY